MEFFDPNHWPIGAKNISKLCNVSLRTAQRWISGKTKPPHSAQVLLKLYQSNRIIPDSWPSHWYINYKGALDIGHHDRAFPPHLIDYALSKLPKYETTSTEQAEHEKAITDVNNIVPVSLWRRGRRKQQQANRY